MSWYLSNYYLLVLFFPYPCSCWQYITAFDPNCLNVCRMSHKFSNTLSVCVVHKRCAQWLQCMCGMWCVGAWLCKMRTDRCREHYCNLCVRVCLGACVHVCTRLSASLIQRGINPIHYLAGLRAAQSMALSVAADELPSLTRCIIQTCRRARLCLAFQSTKETWGQHFYLRQTEKTVSTTLKVCPQHICVYKWFLPRQ